MTEQIVLVSPDDIVVPKERIRSIMSEEEYDSLKSGMDTWGFPGFIEAIQSSDGLKFELVIGENRLRAAKELNMEKVPLKKVNLSEPDIKLKQISENISRGRVNLLEVSEALAKLRKNGLSLLDLSRKLGKSQSWLSKTESFQRLPKGVIKYIDFHNFTSSKSDENSDFRCENFGKESIEKKPVSPTLAGEIVGKIENSSLVTRTIKKAYEECWTIDKFREWSRDKNESEIRKSLLEDFPLKQLNCSICGCGTSQDRVQWRPLCDKDFEAFMEFKARQSPAELVTLKLRNKGDSEKEIFIKHIGDGGVFTMTELIDSGFDESFVKQMRDEQWIFDSSLDKTEIQLTEKAKMALKTGTPIS